MNEFSELQAPQKVPTGIEGFDNITMGGLTEGRTTLVVGSSGSCKTILGVEFLFRGISQFNRPGIFVTFEERPREIVRNVKNMGWSLDEFVEQGKLMFVDVSPDPTFSEETGTYDFSGLITQIQYAVGQLGAQNLVLDSIGALFTQYRDTATIRREIYRLATVLGELGVTAIMTAERLEEYGPISRYGMEEFVSDNVIILRNALEEEKCRRTFQVLKMRGNVHLKGEFPFTLSPTGFSILPLGAMELAQASSTERVSTGNEELDRMTGSGVFRDSIFLLSGPTGGGKTLMCATFIHSACQHGEKVLLLAYEESREQLLRNALSWGMDFQKWEEKGLLKIICIYPETLGMEDHLLMIRREVEAFEPQRLTMDSISALERISTVRNFREFIIALTSYVKERRICTLVTSTTPQLAGGESVTEAHISTITDIIMLIRYVEINGLLCRGIAVIKMRGSQHDKGIREFTIDEQGMHIGAPFKNVQNIILGIPSSLVPTESDQLEQMFRDD